MNRILGVLFASVTVLFGGLPSAQAAEANAEGPPEVLRASALLQEGKPDEALATLDAALKAEPKNLAFRYAKAVALLNLGREVQALSLARDLVKDDPGNKQALALLGRVLLAVGLPVEAIRQLAPVAEGLVPDGDILEVFALACMKTKQPIRAQRAWLECLTVRAGAGEGGLMARSFRSGIVLKDMRKFRPERLRLIVAYALQDNELGIGLCRELAKAGDDEFRQVMVKALAEPLGSSDGYVAKAVLATARGEELPAESANDAHVRRLKTAVGQVMVTVGCEESNRSAVARKRQELTKSIKQSRTEVDGQSVLVVELKAEVDSTLTLDPKGPVAVADLQASTAAVASIALEVQSQQSPERRKQQQLKVIAETGTYEFEVVSEAGRLELTRKAGTWGEEYQQEFDLDGLPDGAHRPF
jgi:tetratricopeptide (TPR) repeat protein